MANSSPKKLSEIANKKRYLYLVEKMQGGTALSRPEITEMENYEKQDRRAEANRQNAQKSTGPKTKEGKARVAKNATKHGFCSKELILPHESREDFEAHREAMLVDLKPEGYMQEEIAERIVVNSWRLRRIPRYDNYQQEFNMLYEDGFSSSHQDKNKFYCELPHGYDRREDLEQMLKDKRETLKEAKELFLLYGKETDFWSKLSLYQQGDVVLAYVKGFGLGEKFQSAVEMIILEDFPDVENLKLELLKVLKKYKVTVSFIEEYAQYYWHELIQKTEEEIYQAEKLSQALVLEHKKSSMLSDQDITRIVRYEAHLRHQISKDMDSLYDMKTRWF